MIKLGLICLVAWTSVQATDFETRLNGNFLRNKNQQLVFESGAMRMVNELGAAFEQDILFTIDKISGPFSKVATWPHECHQIDLSVDTVHSHKPASVPPVKGDPLICLAAHPPGDWLWIHCEDTWKPTEKDCGAKGFVFGEIPKPVFDKKEVIMDVLEPLGGYALLPSFKQLTTFAKFPKKSDGYIAGIYAFLQGRDLASADLEATLTHPDGSTIEFESFSALPWDTSHQSISAKVKESDVAKILGKDLPVSVWTLEVENRSSKDAEIFQEIVYVLRATGDL